MIKRMELSAEERYVIQRLDKAGLLHDMDKEHFQGKENVAVLFCNDGRWALRVIDHFRDMYDREHELGFFPINELGGTLALDDNSPLLKKGSKEFPLGNMKDVNVIEKIKFAVDMGHKALCNIDHFPCGMSRYFNIPPLHIIDSLMMAKRRIKYLEGIAGITVASFLQIGEENGHTRIARIPYEDFLIWRKDDADDASPVMRQMLASFSR